MAYPIGSDTGISTWGAMRTAIGNGDTGFGLGSGANNYEWISGFQTVEGNGFVRLDPFARTGFGATYVDFFSGNTFRLNDATVYIVMDQRDADELITQSVTLTGPDTFAIDADYLTAAGQTVTTTGIFPITAIGLLTPVV
jgi:hypothetical protein